MPFYIPLGPRGFFLRLGTLITGVMGSWIYWRACRRRALLPAPLVTPDGITEG